jgi:hypothetical protein
LATCANSIEDIVMKVRQAFGEYPAERNKKIFLTFQACMREVLKHGGDRYKVPHIRKAVLERLDALSLASIICSAIEFLSDA